MPTLIELQDQRRQLAREMLGLAEQLKNEAKSLLDANWVDDALSDMPKLVTVAEATAVLRCSKRTLYREIHDGRIRVLRQAETGSARLLIPRAELARYLWALFDDGTQPKELRTQ